MTVHTISPVVTKEFSDRGIALDTLFVVVRGDMDASGNFCDVWAAFDEQNFYLLRGYEKLVRAPKKKGLESTFEFLGFEVYDNPEIGKMCVDRMLSTARLMAEKDGISRELMRFTLGLAAKAEFLASRFNSHVAGEPLKEQNQRADSDPVCPKCGMPYPDEHREVCPNCQNRRATSWRLMGFFQRYWKQTGGILLFILLSAAFDLLSPYVSSKMLIDDVLTTGGRFYGQVGLIILLLLSVRILGMLLNIASMRLVGRVVPWMNYDLRMLIFTAMQRLSLGFYTGKQTGSLMNRVNRDAENIYFFFLDGMPNVLSSIVIVAGVVGMMLFLSWKLALVVILSIPVFVLSYMFIWKGVRRAHHNAWVRISRVNSMLSDTLNGRRIIKAFAKEEEEESRFDQMSRRAMRAEYTVANAHATGGFMLQTLSAFEQLMIFIVGGIMVFRKDLPVGTLVVFMMYIGMLNRPMDFLTRVGFWWTRCIDSAQRMFEVIDTQPDVAEKVDALNIPELNGDIEVKNIYFEYEAGRPILKDVTMSVKRGQMLGIVGKTGAGKSTIVNLMARLYDPKEGSISIDGVDVRDIKMGDMRNNIGIVSQEIFLFMGTIADNIRYAKPDADMATVIAAAKAASAHEFIIKLPDGYDTRIGTGGQDLSGGEKQRISIARTIIQNPRILILDEATASMDTETERNIQTALAELRQGRTTISIAHRLSTLRDADVLAVIDNGKMVEFGTHIELINKKGEYYKLYKLQMEALQFIGVGD